MSDWCSCWCCSSRTFCGLDDTDGLWRVRKEGNPILLIMERIGEVSVSGLALIIGFQSQTLDRLVMLAGLRVRCYGTLWDLLDQIFHERKENDWSVHYSSEDTCCRCHPADNPSLLLCVYGPNQFLDIATVILGIGHIGIHLIHARECMNSNKWRHDDYKTESQIPILPSLLPPLAVIRSSLDLNSKKS